MLLPLVLVVLVVVGVIVLVDEVRGSGGSGSGGAVVTPIVSTSTPSPSPMPTSTPPRSTSTPPRRTTPPPSTPAAAPTPPPSATTVQVFNVSRRTGLAQTEASRLRAAGYRVTRVSTKKGVTLGATTVYFTPGDATQQAEAQGVVARGLAATAAPRPAGVAATGTLVVYVTG